MRESRILSFALTALVALGPGGACTSSSSDSASNGGPSGHGGSGGADASVGDAPFDVITADNAHGSVVSIAIDPPAATIVVADGVSTPVTFKAIATWQDSTTSEVGASWQFDKPEIALVTPGGGVVTANGKVGGVGTLKATFEGTTADATVTVDIQVTRNPANLSAADQAAFSTPDTQPSGTMLYPYDKTVFARGLPAPELMWAGGAVGDAWLVHLHEAHYDAKIYAIADPPSDVQIPQDVWDGLTASNAGEDAQVDVLRLSGGQAHAAMHETWTVAQGSLRGTIYYWAVNTGQIMKIGPGATSPDVVFDSGEATDLGTPSPANYNGTYPPWASGGNNKRCVACHVVSKDGSRLAAVFEKNGNTASPWGTVDLGASPPYLMQITPYDSTAIYLALTPEGSVAVQNNGDMTMRMVLASTGDVLPSALDSFPDRTADPAFSPDGKLLAFSSHVQGYYPVEFYGADLDVMDFDLPTKVFSNRRTVAVGGGQAIAFPSFSPDSKWILFQMGDYSRAKYGDANNKTGHDDLYMVDVAGQGQPIALANASGAGLDARNRHLAYQPTVNPVAVGGYMWVVFVSPRDYGNKMLSTSDPSMENRKQLWVAAVDLNPQPGQDPSHPAFWLPGQDLSTINMSGYWALEPCRQNGTSCDAGFECCTGFCRSDGNGGSTCVPPPPGGCSNIGEKCSNDGDCCGAGTGVSCIGGICGQSTPH